MQMAPHDTEKGSLIIHHSCSNAINGRTLSRSERINFVLYLSQEPTPFVELQSNREFQEAQNFPSLLDK